MISREEAKQEIYEEWRQWTQGASSISGKEIIAFFLWLDDNRPDLLAFECNGAKSERIRVWLRQLEQDGSSARPSGVPRA